jgi:hypothetical protein
MKMLPHTGCVGEIVEEEEDVENVENHSIVNTEHCLALLGFCIHWK